MARLNLGDRVRDRITGYQGICVTRIAYLTGCDQIGIKPQGQKPDGGTFDVLHFDEPFVELIEANAVAPVVERKADAGGPAIVVRQG